MRRFTLVGALGAGGSWLTFLALYSVFQVSNSVAVAITILAWLLPSFEMQRRWVFESGKGGLNFFVFALIHLLTIPLYASGLYILSHQFEIWPPLAYGILIGFVSALVFVALKVIVFPARSGY